MIAWSRGVECNACRILLAKVDGHGLCIERGKLQVTIDGTFHASLVCYRCGALNVLRIPAEHAAATRSV